MQLPGLDSVGHHVREAAKFAPGRPALWLGLRTAAATAVPLLIAPYLSPVAAGWAPLAGFIVALVDKGGAYRSRAIAMTSVAIGGLIAVLLGSLISGHGIVTAIVVAMGLSLCALSLAFGAAFVSVGNTIALQLLVAASQPCEPGVAIERAIGFAGGAGFALVLSLIVWPVRVYKPARRAVASVYRMLAAHTGAWAQADGPTWREAAMRRHRAIRDQIEVARVVMAATRRGRRGETGRGERLLAMVQLAEQIFGVLVGLEEALEAGASPELREAARGGLGALASGLDEIADNVLLEHPPASRAPAWTTRLPEKSSDALAHTLDLHAHALLVRLHADRATAASVLASIEKETEPLKAILPEPDPPVRWRERFREAFDPDGVVLRHVVRVTLVVTLAMVIARELDLEHRYWVTLTAFLLLQPHASATRIRAVQRVVGTIAGGLVAALVPWAVNDPRITLLLVVVLAGTSASVLQLNYALYATFLTPTFILLAEAHVHDQHLIGTRIVNTLLGAGLVLLGSLVWPVRPSRRFDDVVSDAYVAGATYLETVVAAILAATPQPSPGVTSARRAYGLAINRAEAALDALVGERAPTATTEPRMTQIVFSRRLASAISALGATRTMADYAPHHVELAAFAASTAAALRQLSRAYEGESIVARPRMERTATDPLLAARLARIDLAVVALVEAALRCDHDGAPARSGELPRHDAR